MKKIRQIMRLPLVSLNMQWLWNIMFNIFCNIVNFEINMSNAIRGKEQSYVAAGITVIELYSRTLGIV